MIITGKAYKITQNEDNISTDAIWPGKYTYIQMDEEEMRNHAMENFDAKFNEKVKNCTVLVAGRNFGCGSSREQAVTALRSAGIKAIIARSFARIYYRNAINLGVAVIESNEIVDAIQNGYMVKIDLENGIVEFNKKKHSFSKYPAFVLDLIHNGGLINMIRKQVEAGKIPAEG